MKLWIKILSVFLFFSLIFLPKITEARSGCCSHHGGVCGCRCCDGSSLSATCAPYYPSCNSTKVVTQPTSTPKPTATPTKKPTSTPTLTDTSKSTPSLELDKVLGTNTTENSSDGSLGGLLVLGLIGYGGYKFFKNKNKKNEKRKNKKRKNEKSNKARK